MKRHLALGLVWLAALSVQACTIFVLTDTNRVLFCNNEDWANPMTRVWFVPASEGRYGCAFVGFDDGFVQGGLNTEGLAFDGVNVGANEKWEPAPGMVTLANGEVTERLLKNCATMTEAVAYYRTNFEPCFTTSRIIVADKTGASVIIGAKDGKLFVDPANKCRGFGYGQRTMNEMLAASSEPTVANGIKILRACAQRGPNATKYSNLFDLKSGDIFIYRRSASEPDAKLNLAAELKKPAHYYDIPKIREQLKQSPRPIAAMKSFLAGAFQAGPDPEPKVTARVRKMVEDAARGEMRAADYAPEFWKTISDKQKQFQAHLDALGDLISVAPVERSKEGKERSYWFRLEFSKATLLQIFVLDAGNRVTFSNAVDTFQKTQTAATSFH